MIQHRCLIAPLAPDGSPGDVAAPRSRRREVRRWSRGAGPFVVLAIAFGLAVAVVAAEPAGAATACRTVGGASAPADGDHHATVIVDTGSGPVWSACISFSGTISGTDALGLAESTIRDLKPVYNSYTGVGRAVCKLRGVGNDGDGCLGATAEYWSYHRNGGYSPGGAGVTKVSDGDVEGWRWGTGVAPRAATVGTEAATATVPPTRPPVTARPPVTTRPPVGTVPRPGAPPTGSSGNGSSGAGAGAPPPASPGAPAPTTPDGATVAPSPGATVDPSPTTGPPGAPSSTGERTRRGRLERRAAEGPAGARAPQTESNETMASSGDADGTSSSGSLMVFAVLLAAAGGAGIYLRHRRTVSEPYRHLPPPPA